MTTDPLYSGMSVPERPESRPAAAKEEAREVAHEAAASAGVVRDVAKQEASTVAHEAAYQAKDLLAQSRRELMDQAAHQQSRAAEGLRSIHRELSSMASNSDGTGVGTDLVRQAADRTASLADWLDQRDPGSLLNEVKSYARRRPGMFLAIAAGAGLLAGRLSRSLVAEATEERADGARYRTAVPEGYDRTRAASTYTDTQGYGYGQPTGAMGEYGTPAYGQTTGETTGVGGYAGSKGYGEAAASAGAMAGSQSYDEGAMAQGAGAQGTYGASEGYGQQGQYTEGQYAGDQYTQGYSQTPEAQGGYTSAASGDAYQSGPGEAPYGAPVGDDAYPQVGETENAAAYGETDRGSEYETPSEAGEPIPGVGDKGRIDVDKENRLRREGDEQR